MYRIVCESYDNFKKDFPDGARDSYRYLVAKPLELIVDLPLYQEEKNQNTAMYRKLETYIYLIKKDMSSYPNFKSLLWSLESRGITGHDFGALSPEEFSELTKIINMFLRLAYWG